MGQRNALREVSWAAMQLAALLSQHLVQRGRRGAAPCSRACRSCCRSSASHARGAAQRVRVQVPAGALLRRRVHARADLQAQAVI